MVKKGNSLVTGTLKLKTTICPLGDSISVLFGLYNYSMYHRTRIIISAICNQAYATFRELLFLFNCPLVSLAPFKKTDGISIDYMFESFWSNYFKNIPNCMPWTLKVYHGLVKKFGGYYSGRTLFPKCSLKKTNDEKITLVQFDSRSTNVNQNLIQSHHFKNPLNTKEMYNAIALFAKTDKIALLGGSDTKPYLKYDCRFGSLSYIVQQLLNCEMFIGCDSGISHLAGLLRTNSVIIPLARPERVEEYYATYPNTKIVRRDKLSIEK